MFKTLFINKNVRAIGGIGIFAKPRFLLALP